MMKLIWLAAMFMLVFSAIASASHNTGGKLPQPLVNITVLKPGLVVEKIATTGEDIQLVLRNTAAEPIPVESLSFRVDAPFNVSCSLEAPFLASRVLSCHYDSVSDEAFRSLSILPKGEIAVKIQLRGLVVLLQPNWSSEAMISIKLGNYTLRKKLLFTASLSGEVKQTDPHTVRVLLKIEGNSTLRVVLRATLRMNASLTDMHEIHFRNFAGGITIESESLKLAGEAAPPARLELCLHARAPPGAESGYVTPLSLQLPEGALKLGSITLTPREVLLKPLLFPYAYEVEVLGKGSYVLIAVGPHVYNVTLKENRGFLTLGEAFWPLLESYSLRPLEVVEEGTLRYPAASVGGELTVLTGGVTVALFAAIVSASSVYALSLYRLRKKCRPFIELEE